MSFFSLTNHPKGVDVGYTSAGEQYAIEYVEALNDDGFPCLVPDRKIDLHALHELGRESCDLKQAILRFQAGDVTALDQRHGFFADVTELPTTPMEVSKLAIRARSVFMTLPAEDRAKFSNSVDIWLSKLMSGDEVAASTLGIETKAADVVPPVPVAKDTIDVVAPVLKGDVQE